MVDASDSDIASSVESESQFQYIIDIPEKNHKELCIYRVPPKLRQLNAKAYTPQLISIGPFHHGKPQFKVMETQKKRYYHEFLERIKSERSNFDEFKVNYIKRMLGDIRKCYEEKSNLGDDKFAEMIELDAVFIMEFFLRLTEKDQHKDDYVMSKPWLTEGICLDLILLENQLPIEVLKELYEFVPEDKEKAKECCTFLDLACDKIAKARLELPQLIIDDGTECKLRNLIALEQCHYYPDYMFIYNYVSLIDGLIETKEDVNFLLGEKVIANYLGSNHAVEKLVNSLCRELVTGRNYYQEEINELNKHCGDLFNLTMGTLRSVYLKDLWRASSTIVGLAVLAFTFVNFFRATLK
ncbi:hypothetical protein O6P43_017322 [Quillaja saponaria]|uniref:Uncharacterized protein n=1 Tax=Quillaja saponaria TaxID=32244 RepID=A0AAD7LQ51_QUISA|nr:hypothetical protein O6P43_017322 [Quillaja saponaria]